MADPANPTTKLDDALLSILVCPLTRSPLRQDGDTLVAAEPPEAGLRYPIRDGIPVLLVDEAMLPDGVDSLEGFKQKYASFVAPPA
ncbi:MAG: Trm112 family protein [Planctomycetota bacterium]